MSRALSTSISVMPYFRHSFRRMATSWRARRLGIVKQRYLVAGLTRNRRANQFCWMSIFLPLASLSSQALEEIPGLAPGRLALPLSRVSVSGFDLSQ